MKTHYCPAFTAAGLGVALLSCALLVACGKEEESEIRTVSLGEWKQALAATYRVISTEQSSAGSTVSVVCVNDPDGGKCIPARLTLSPFDEGAYFEPTAHAANDDATVFTQVVIRDGRQPEIVVSGALSGGYRMSGPTVALVVDGSLLFDTSDPDPSKGHSNSTFGLNPWSSASVLSGEMLVAIRGMNDQSAVKAKISGDRRAENTSDSAVVISPSSSEYIDTYLDDVGNQTLKENLKSMEAIDRTVRAAIGELRVASVT